MSLINDALRKARQAASEHEAQQPEAPFRAYPTRGRRPRSGAAIVVLTVVVAAIAGAAAAWWFMRSAQSVAHLDTTEIQGRSPERQATSDGGPVEPISEAQDAVENEPVQSEVTAQRQETDLEPVASEPENEIDGETPRVVEPTSSRAPPLNASGEREFILDANLGYASLSLGYIVFRSTRSFAEINGTDIYVGSEVEGFVVEAIEVDRVVLRDDRGRLILRVP